MAADVVEKLVPALQETAGQNEDHLFCCDEDISLCGPECTGRGYR